MNCCSLATDIVFIRTWLPVEVPPFYNPVTTLLEPAAERARWVGMRTAGQLRREHGVKREPNTDSLYRVRACVS